MNSKEKFFKIYWNLKYLFKKVILILICIYMEFICVKNKIRVCNVKILCRYNKFWIIYISINVYVIIFWFFLVVKKLLEISYLFV